MTLLRSEPVLKKYLLTMKRAQKGLNTHARSSSTLHAISLFLQNKLSNNKLTKKNLSSQTLFAFILDFFTSKAKLNFHVFSLQAISKESVNSFCHLVFSIQTHYISMLLHLDEILTLHTILAGLFT